MATFEQALLTSTEGNSGQAEFYAVVISIDNPWYVTSQTEGGPAYHQLSTDTTIPDAAAEADTYLQGLGYIRVNAWRTNLDGTSATSVWVLPAP